MFDLFGNRKKFNGGVDAHLNLYYLIKTRNNPLFPGESTYLGLLGTAWQNNLSYQEASYSIACSYFAGCVRQGYTAEARKIAGRIPVIATSDNLNGHIRHDLFEQMLQQYAETLAILDDLDDNQAL
jgi:hypothetical protein